MAINANLPFIIKLDTDLLIGAVIRAKTDGNAAKQQERAKVALDVLAALAQINSDDVTGGMQALDNIVTKTGDPAFAAALQTTVIWIAGKAQAIEQFLSGSIASSQIATLMGQAITEATTIAQKYAAPPATTPQANAAAAAANTKPVQT